MRHDDVTAHLLLKFRALTDEQLTAEMKALLHAEQAAIARGTRHPKTAGDRALEIVWGERKLSLRPASSWCEGVSGSRLGGNGRGHSI